MQLKIPVTIPAGSVPLICHYFPSTGDFRTLEIDEVASDHVTISRRNFDAIRGLYYLDYEDLGKLKGVTPQGIVVFGVSSDWAKAVKWSEQSAEIDAIVLAMKEMKRREDEDKKPVDPGIAKTVRIEFRDPKFARHADWARPELCVVGTCATATPKVTYKLTLIHLGDVATRTTTIEKTVEIASGGSPVATFTDVPALTAIAEVHVENGKIGDWAEYRGVADIMREIPAPEPTFHGNCLVVVPTGSHFPMDFAASVVSSLVKRGSSYGVSGEELAARVLHFADHSATNVSFFEQTGKTLDENAVDVVERALKRVPVIVAHKPIILFKSRCRRESREVSLSNSRGWFAGGHVILKGMTIPTGDELVISCSEIVRIEPPLRGKTLVPLPVLIATLNGQPILTRSKAPVVRIPTTCTHGGMPDAQVFFRATGRTLSLQTYHSPGSSTFGLVMPNEWNTAGKMSAQGILIFEVSALGL